MVKDPIMYSFSEIVNLVLVQTEGFLKCSDSSLFQLEAKGQVHDLRLANKNLLKNFESEPSGIQK